MPDPAARVPPESCHRVFLRTETFTPSDDYRRERSAVSQPEAPDIPGHRCRHRAPKSNACRAFIPVIATWSPGSYSCRGRNRRPICDAHRLRCTLRQMPRCNWRLDAPYLHYEWVRLRRSSRGLCLQKSGFERTPRHVSQVCARSPGDPLRHGGAYCRRALWNGNRGKRAEIRLRCYSNALRKQSISACSAFPL